MASTLYLDTAFVKWRIRERGLRARQLAEAFHRSEAWISLRVNAREPIDAMALRRLAILLDVDEPELLVRRHEEAA